MSIHSRLPQLALLWLSFGPTLHAQSLRQDFSADPTLGGWKTFGDTNLFAWDPGDQNLQVTWDSSRPNSYFYHPLGTILAKDDDFGLEFDVRLSDISTNAKSGPFEIAVGFLNFNEAMRPDLWRGSGADPIHGPRSIVELDYFPAGYYPDFGPVDPSFSPTLISSNNGFASGFDLFAMTNNSLYHVRLQYTATNQTLRTVITADGMPIGPIDDVVLGANFTDFRLDTVAVMSYSDTGDDFDSVLAHGTVDNLVIMTPPPPVGNAVGGFLGQGWQVQFTGRTNWIYTLERTTDFQFWQSLQSATNIPWALLDTNAPSGKAFYRVRAERP